MVCRPGEHFRKVLLIWISIIGIFFYLLKSCDFKSKPLLFKRKTLENFSINLFLQFILFYFIFCGIGVLIQYIHTYIHTYIYIYIYIYIQNKLLFLKNFIIKIKIMEFLNLNPFPSGKTHETFFF